MDLPDLVTRRDIMAVTLAGNRLGPDVNLTRVAEALEGYTGSDIKEVILSRHFFLRNILAILDICHVTLVLIDF